MKNIFSLLLIAIIVLSCGNKSERINDVSQLADKRICVLTGSAGDFGAHKAFPNAVFINMVTAPDAALAVKTGKADAFVHNKIILMGIVDRDSSLKILEPFVSETALAAAIKKGNTALQIQIDQALNLLKEKGELISLRQKWIESAYSIVPDLDKQNEITSNKVLRMGTCALAEPLTFIHQNKLTGFDIDLAFKIGVILQKKIEIINMPFDSLIPALESGKIDFALSNFNVTEERKKRIDFSEPYLINEISALVKK